MRSIVVHYKELALKGRNRPWFVQLLVRNIRTALRGIEVTSVRSVMGRIEIDLGAGASFDAARDRLRQVFGIANFSLAGRGPHDFQGLADAILEDLGNREAASFRVSARRADKRIPYTSPEIEREVGGLIKVAKGWTVDLDEGDYLIGAALPFQVSTGSKLTVGVAYTKGSNNFVKIGTDHKMVNTAAVGRTVFTLSYAITF